MSALQLVPTALAVAAVQAVGEKARAACSHPAQSWNHPGEAPYLIFKRCQRCGVRTDDDIRRTMYDGQ